MIGTVLFSENAGEGAIERARAYIEFFGLKKDEVKLANRAPEDKPTEICVVIYAIKDFVLKSTGDSFLEFLTEKGL